MKSRRSSDATDAERLQGATAAGPASSPDVAVVTVTYGARWGFLEKLLTALLQDHPEVARIVVVDNGCKYDLTGRLATVGTTKIVTVTMGRNAGSAAGYRAGIEAAMSRTAVRFIWLLDDDNLPRPRALAELMKRVATASASPELDDCALVSFRPEHQSDIASGVPLRRCYPRPGSFFGFHLLDIPYKLWRRTRWGKPCLRGALPDLIPLPFAPYSGLFFCRSLIRRIGLPKGELVLYADDTEFTSRVGTAGGTIHLVPESRLSDMEASWNAKGRFASSLTMWLCGGDDARAFYSARNQSFWEATTGCRPGLRRVNKFIYLTAMAACAVAKGRISRLALLLEAVRAGEAGVLGIDERFRLT